MTRTSRRRRTISKHFFMAASQGASAGKGGADLALAAPPALKDEPHNATSQALRCPVPGTLLTLDNGNTVKALSTEGMICTYLGPLDAVMGSMDLHDGDDHFWPIDFRCVDTRHFLEQNGSLNVSVNYAFAADRGRIVIGKRAQPIMVYTGDSFEIPRDLWDHFSIQFSGRVVDVIEDTLVKAGLPNFSETLEAMDSWSSAEIADAAEQAIARMPPTVLFEDIGKTSMDQCAIYDPESCDWLFVDFDQAKEPHR